MVYTYNGCYHTPLKVLPANWSTTRASISKDWRIYYRFYDPATRGTADWGRLIVIKGMNRSKTLQDRQDVTRALLEHENNLLAVRGWNPIACVFMADAAAAAQSHNLQDALQLAVDKLTGNRFVINDTRSVVKGFKAAAGRLWDAQAGCSYLQMQITEVRPKHIRDALEECYKVNSNFTDKRFNRYRDYLSRLFRILVDMDVLQSNPVANVRKKAVIKRQTQVLTPEEETKIHNHLIEKNYTFWRFMMIFFYSDTRITELLQVRKNAMVNLQRQEFTVEVVKGRARREVVKQISNDVLYLWQELWDQAKNGDYLFSKGLKPGNQKIRHDQPTRRWTRMVKKGLGIKKDFRSLNHLHLTKVAEAIGIKAAAASRGHTTPVITMTRYDVNHRQRLLDEVKKSGVKFGGQ